MTPSYPDVDGFVDLLVRLRVELSLARLGRAEGRRTDSLCQFDSVIYILPWSYEYAQSVEVAVLLKTRVDS